MKNLQEIEILDYETDVQGSQQSIKYRDSIPSRWQYYFPFWIDYGVGNEEMARPLHCDFADVCEWAELNGLIQEYSLETVDGDILIEGTTEMQYNHQIDDWVEYSSGNYRLTFSQFLSEFLDDDDLAKFIIYWKRGQILMGKSE